MKKKTPKAVTTSNEKKLIIFSSDWHIGLKTDEIDRTEEIIKIGKQIISHCVKKKKLGFDVLLILGGDLFNTNTPSENQIASLLVIISLTKKHDIKTIVMDGNHDSVADPDRLSCLNFLKEAKIGFPNVILVQDIKFLSMGETENGPLYFTFLPHISKATVERLVRDEKLEERVSPQEYIDSKSLAILKKVGPAAQHYVFSHLNVMGAHPGSEENLLKRSDVVLPSAFTNTPVGYVIPTIIQAHIHSHQIIDNINIVGSPIYCTFGEKLGPKYFCEIEISNNIGKKDRIEFIPTDCRQFHRLELDMLGETRDFFEIEEVTAFMNQLNPEQQPIVKIEITISPENNTYNWDAIRSRISREFNCDVKPIIPRVIFKRQVRSVEQKITLTAKQATQVYLKKNLRKEKDKAKRIYARALKYLED